MPLTRFELETIINFNQGDDTAYLFTYSKTWQRHCEQRLGLRPVHVNSFGGKDYEIPKRFIRLPLPPRHISDEEMVLLRERGRKLQAGAYKSRSKTEYKGQVSDG